MNGEIRNAIIRSAMREIPCADDLTEKQKELIAEWYVDALDNEKNDNEKIINKEDCKKFVGLIPIAVIIGLHFAKWKLTLSGLLSVIAAYVFSAILFFVFGKGYEVFVIKRANSVIGTVIFVIISCVIATIIGMLFFNVK